MGLTDSKQRPPGSVGLWAHFWAFSRRPIVRFLAFGAFSVGLNLVLYWVLVGQWGLNYLLATVIVFLIGNLVGFSLNRRFTFTAKSAGGHRRGQMIRWYAVMGLSLLLNLGLMAALISGAGLSYLLASPIVSVIFALGNFVAHDRFTFAQAKDRADRPILLVTHYYAGHGGGIEIVAGELAQRIGPTVPICWCASGPLSGTSPGVSLVPLRAWNGIERKLGLPLPIPGPRSAWRLARLAAEARAVWVHDLLYPSNLLAATIALLCRRPLFVTIHVGAIPYRSRALAALMRWSLHLSGHLFLPRAAGVVFISERVRDEFATWIRLPRATFIPNGVDITVFSPADPDKRAQLRRELGLDTRPAILFVGRFVERKGLPLLHELVTARPDLQWLFAGAGPLDPGAWKMSGVLIFRGCRGSSLAQVYQAADLLALPSLGEGFPLVVAEALACGLPVLVDPSTLAGYAASSAVITAEPVEGSEAVARWSDRIDQLIEAGDRDSGSLIRATFARQHWDWGACADRYVELLGGSSHGSG